MSEEKLYRFIPLNSKSPVRTKITVFSFNYYRFYFLHNASILFLMFNEQQKLWICNSIWCQINFLFNFKCWICKIVMGCEFWKIVLDLKEQKRWICSFIWCEISFYLILNVEFVGLWILENCFRFAQSFGGIIRACFAEPAGGGWKRPGTADKLFGTRRCADAKSVLARSTGTHYQRFRSSSSAGQHPHHSQSSSTDWRWKLFLYRWKSCWGNWTCRSNHCFKCVFNTNFHFCKINKLLNMKY